MEMRQSNINHKCKVNPLKWISTRIMVVQVYESNASMGIASPQCSHGYRLTYVRARRACYIGQVRASTPRVQRGITVPVNSATSPSPPYPPRPHPRSPSQLAQPHSRIRPHPLPDSHPTLVSTPVFSPLHRWRTSHLVRLLYLWVIIDLDVHDGTLSR